MRRHYRQPAPAFQAGGRQREDLEVSGQTVLIAQSGGVTQLTLNRHDKLNAFTLAMHAELNAGLQAANADPQCRVVVLTGAGRAFCAGQDLAEVGGPTDPSAPDAGSRLEKAYNPLIKLIASLEKPVICAVNGIAAGAGANIALACDIVVAARSAKFIQSFAAIGLIPDSGGTWVLPRVVGQARALGLALTGEALPAEKAEEWGMIWKAVDDDALDAEVDAIADKLASFPPLGLAEIKKMIRASWAHTLDQELNHQRDTMRHLGFTEDYREGVTAFLEKREPKFTGR